MLNLTPVVTDPADGSPAGVSKVNYPAAPYAVTLKIEELGGSARQFTVFRSQPAGRGAATVKERLTAANGQLTVTIQPQELVTLHCAPIAGGIH